MHHERAENGRGRVRPGAERWGNNQQSQVDDLPGPSVLEDLHYISMLIM